MKGNKGLHTVTSILLWVGGLNWGIFALTGWDVGQIFPDGMQGTIAKLIYILVGLSAVYEIIIHKADCRLCNPGGGMNTMGK